ncbi:hypothetical protein KY285_007707 [Solanum tuberosum]|nr:hypothetical protein KY285_007707 [Solanum tuberosum]
MNITCQDDFGISDENSVIAPSPVNRKRKRMSRPREEDISILIEVLHDDARKYAFNGSTISGPRWRVINDEFWTKTGKQDYYDENRIKTKCRALKKDLKDFKDLLQSCSGYGWDPETNTITCPSDIWRQHVEEKRKKGVNISKFKLKGLNQYDLLDEIFGKSIATGSHVVYSTIHVSQPAIDEPVEVEDDIFSCDNNPDNTEDVYQPMSVNTDNDNGSGKRTACDVSIRTNGITSSRHKKNRATTTEGIFNDLKEHLKWKRDKEEAKEKEKREREQAQSSTHNEIDIYSEQVVIIQLQNLMTKHNIDKRQFSLAVPHFLNLSIRKMFVHMTEEYQVQWIED